MNRHGPAGPGLIESPGAVQVVAAHLQILHGFNPAAHLPPHVQPADQVVREDELERGRAGLKCRLEPFVLHSPQGQTPVSRLLRRFGLVPVRVQRDEQRIAPLERIPGLAQPDEGFLPAAARVEAVRLRIGEVRLAPQRSEDRDVVRGSVQPPAPFPFVVAHDKEQGHRVVDQVEIGTQQLNAAFDLLRRDRAQPQVPVDEECVAQVEHEVGIVREHLREAQLEGFRIVRLHHVRVELHDECERAAGWPRCVEGALETLSKALRTRFPVAHAVVVARVRL